MEKAEILGKDIQDSLVKTIIVRLLYNQNQIFTSNLNYWHFFVTNFAKNSYLSKNLKLSKAIENILIDEFKHRDSFTRKELSNFYMKYEPDLKDGTLGWRIYDLKNKNIIRPIKSGLYVISEKPKFKPELSPKALKLARLVSQHFPDINYCIWETRWLNEFLQHQSAARIIIIEIEKDFAESLYFKLKDLDTEELFLTPNFKETRLYIPESASPVIIEKLITRSPLVKRTEQKIEIYVPRLEKIMVDLFSAGWLYFSLSFELVHIYENIIEKYVVNFTKLLSYAKRREKECEIKQFILQHMSHLVKDILDD